VSRKLHKGKLESVSPRTRWLLSILILLAVAAYWNSFDAPFVFDDLLSIQRNPAVRFGEFDWHLLNPRAVLYLTFTLNHVLSQQDVWSYHLVNLILHTLNGVLVFFFARNLFQSVDSDPRRNAIYALAASSFFLVHPVQTESVTYISSRSELLSTNFYLAALLLFQKWPVSRIGFIFSLLVGVPFFLALGSKESAISLPAAILLYDFLFLSKGSVRGVAQRWRFYATFIFGGIAAAVYIVNVGLRGSVGEGLKGHLSSWHYLLTQSRVIVRYVSLIFWPAGLNLDYDFRPSTSLTEPAVIASGLFLLAILGFGWFLRSRTPVFAFSIFWFFLTLAPTSSVMPILDVIFEHRLYLPMVGVCLSFPFIAELMSREFKKRLGLGLRAGTYSVTIVLLLMIGTVLRNEIWRDEVRLWTDVAAKSPDKVRPYNSLAFAYFKKGQYQPAVTVLEKALAEHPKTQDELLDILGNLYFKTDQLDKAVELFKKGIQTKDKSRLMIEYNNLGVAYLYKWHKLASQQNQMPPQVFAEQKESILRASADAFAKCVEIEPRAFSALDSFVNVATYLGGTEDLEARALVSLQKKETFNELYIVGKIAFNRNDFARADEFFTRAEKLNDGEKLLFHNHGYALNVLKQKDAAIDKYLQAIRLDPIFIEAHHNVGLIYVERGALDQARDHFLEVLRYDPNHISANLNLAWIFGTQGNKTVARGYLKTVLNVSPGNERATQIAQQLGL
jgi:protein O-mannosyl-transferase